MARQSFTLMSHAWKWICGAVAALMYCGDALAIIPSPTQPNALQRQEQVAASTVLFRSAGGNLCSATVVGTQVLMTAANCVSTSNQVVAQVGQESYALRCGRLSGSTEVFVDLALCVAERPFSSLRPVQVDFVKPLVIGETVLVAGYGCSGAHGFGSATGGKYSQGQARVVSVQAGKDKEPLALISGAAACFGDAGGGVFRITGNPAQSPRLVGIISRGDLYQNSWIVPIVAELPGDRLRTWAASSGVDICGIGAWGLGCAQSEIAPNTWYDAQSVLLSFRGSVVADHAQRSTGQLVKAQGERSETVAQAFQRVCGVPLHSVPGVGADKIAQATSTKGEPGSVLELPVCPVVSTASASATKTVQPGDTVWMYFRSMKDGSATLPALAQSKTEFADYEKRFQQANPNVAITPLMPNVVVNVPPIVPVAAAKPLPVAATAPPQALPTLHLSSSEADAACSAASPGAHPYNLPLLMDLLAMNRRRSDIRPAPVAITIADSGLQGALSGVFLGHVLSKRSGKDLPDFVSSITPLVINEDARVHGTMVASVALGGPLFARFSALDPTPRIQLAVHRIYFTPASTSRSNEDGVNADMTLFDHLIRIADSTDATIVNLSLRSTVKIAPIETNMRNKSNLLFVAAAGNQGKKLSADAAHDTEAAWPALYGGQSSERVLTVLALNGDGKRASFSNWGERFVDIAAPGCKVPALVWNSELERFFERPVSGTSLAAPLVSFAAAMIRSESGGGVYPAQIKRRLLVSADLSLEAPLRHEVADGRKLNVAKAVAIRNDLAETTKGVLQVGDARFLDGAIVLRNSDFLEFDCERESPLRVKRSNLYKLARWLPGSDGPRFRIYYQGAEAELFAWDSCKTPSSIKLEFKKASGEIFPIDWADLQDLVMRTAD